MTTETRNTASLTARPIHFTANVEAAAARLRSLGLRRIDDTSPSDGWQEFAAPAGGRIGIHYAKPESDLDGKSRIGFEVTDIETLHDIANIFTDHPGGATAEIVETGHGTALRVTARDGLVFLIDIAPPDIENLAAEPGVEIAQMWFTPDVSGARAILARLGTTELVTTGGGGWVDTRSPGGGRTQLESTTAPVHVSVGFMYAGDLETLRDDVIAAGVPEAAVVDEAWGQYLDLGPLTENGPTGLDGELTWVNHELTDTYGYQVH